jgi:hypothetical protein
MTGFERRASSNSQLPISFLLHTRIGRSRPHSPSYQFPFIEQSRASRHPPRKEVIEPHGR